MKVKKYSGTSLEKIREVIVKELGPDAVIVNIKDKVEKNGILPIGRKKGFEVIAAVEDAVNADQVSLDQLSGAPLEELIETQKEQYRALRNSMKRIDEKLADVDDRMGLISNGPASGRDESKQLCNVHGEWRPLVTEALKKICGGAVPTDEDWHEAMASLIPTAGGIMFRRTPSSAPDVYVLIGPTGVGKTTTLAKLAAKCVLGEKLNVGLITTDTFRVAAVDQLREYASLLGIELEVAFSAQELEQHLKHFHDKDVVFIDSPGRSQYDSSGIKDIRENLGTIAGLCVLLVVPASIRKEDAEIVYKNYKVLKPSALVISKTDEASRCDGLTKLLDTSNLPVVYLADGQRVPEDLHIASPGVVASLVMPFVKSSEPVKIGDSANV